MHATIYPLLSMLPSPVWQHGVADTHSVLSSRRRADSCAEETISAMPRTDVSESQLAAVEVQVRDATQALGLNDLTSLAQPLGVRVVHQSGELRFDTEVDCQGSFSPACNASNGSVSSKPFADAIYAAVSDATPEPLSTPAPRLR